MQSSYVDVYIWNDCCVSYFKSLACGQVVRLSRFVIKRRFFQSVSSSDAHAWSELEEGPSVELAVNKLSKGGQIEVLVELGEKRFEDVIEKYQVRVVEADELASMVLDQASVTKAWLLWSMFNVDVQMESRCPRWDVCHVVDWVGRLEYVHVSGERDGYRHREGAKRRIYYRWLVLDAAPSKLVSNIYIRLSCNSDCATLEAIQVGQRLVLTEVGVIRHGEMWIALSTSFTRVHILSDDDADGSHAKSVEHQPGKRRKVVIERNRPVWSKEKKFHSFTLWFSRADEYERYCRAKQVTISLADAELLRVRMLERKEWILSSCRIIGVSCLQPWHDVPSEPFFEQEVLDRLSAMAAATNFNQSRAVYYLILVQQPSSAIDAVRLDQFDDAPKLLVAIPMCSQLMRTQSLSEGREITGNRLKRRAWILNLLGIQQKGYDKLNEVGFCRKLSTTLLEADLIYDVGISVYQDRGGRTEITVSMFKLNKLRKNASTCEQDYDVGDAKDDKRAEEAAPSDKASQSWTDEGEEKQQKSIFSLRKSGKGRRGQSNVVNAAELRVQRDLSEMNLQEMPGVTVNWPDVNSLMKFDVHIQPLEGFYRDAKFTFSVKVPGSYPFDPPKVRCETMVFHPNIDTEGHVCLNILRSDWKPVLTISSVIIGLAYLFAEPNPDDPLNKEAANMMLNRTNEFEYTIRKTLRGGHAMGRYYPKLI